jgi:uncharacterized protein YuzE
MIKDDSVYLRHMLDQARKIVSKVESKSRAEVDADENLRLALLNSSYDADGDVLYVSFGPPRTATDSELLDDDIIVRYSDEEIIGYTILHASKRTDKEDGTDEGDGEI